MYSDANSFRFCFASTPAHEALEIFLKLGGDVDIDLPHTDQYTGRVCIG